MVKESVPRTTVDIQIRQPSDAAQLLEKLPLGLAQRLQDKIAPERLNEAINLLWQGFAQRKDFIVLQRALNEHGINQLTSAILKGIRKEWGFGVSKRGRQPLPDTDARVIKLQEILQTVTKPVNVSRLAEETELSVSFVTRYLDARKIQRRRKNSWSLSSKPPEMTSVRDTIRSQQPAGKLHRLITGLRPLNKTSHVNITRDLEASRVIYLNSQIKEVYLVLIRQVIQEIYPKLSPDSLDGEVYFTILQLDINEYSVARRFEELQGNHIDDSQIREIIKKEILELRRGTEYDYLLPESGIVLD